MSIKDLRDFDEGLKEYLTNYFKDKPYTFKDENGKSKSITVNVMYKKPEGEFKTLEYDNSLSIYFENIDEEPDYRRDVPEVEYEVEEETASMIKIKLPPKKLDLFYLIGYKTNKMDKSSFLWTGLLKCLGDRGCIDIKDIPIYYFKSGVKKKDSKEDRIITKEFIYRFKAEMDIHPAEWVPKVLYVPQIIVQTVEKNEDGKFDILTSEVNDLELF